VCSGMQDNATPEAFEEARFSLGSLTTAATSRDQPASLTS
jgi:hypothetical protein